MVGNRRGPFDIVGVVLPDIVGVVRPVGVIRPDRTGVICFGVDEDLGVDNVLGLGGVGVVRPNDDVGVGVVDRPKGCRGLMYLGVELAEGVRGLVGVVMFDDEELRRFDRDKLPDEPANRW